MLHRLCWKASIFYQPPWSCAAVSQGEVYKRIYLLFPSLEDDSKVYTVTKLQKVTKEEVVAALQPLGVLGMIPKDQVFDEPDSSPTDGGTAVQLLSQSELHEGGEYIVIFARSTLESQVCKHLALAKNPMMCVFECLAIRALSH